METHGVKHGLAWTTILEYGLQIRKAATKSINFDGMDIAAALKKARKDTELRDKYFTTPPPRIRDVEATPLSAEKLTDQLPTMPNFTETAHVEDSKMEHEGQGLNTEASKEEHNKGLDDEASKIEHDLVPVDRSVEANKLEHNMENDKEKVDGRPPEVLKKGAEM